MLKEAAWLCVKSEPRSVKAGSGLIFLEPWYATEVGVNVTAGLIMGTLAEVHHPLGVGTRGQIEERHRLPDSQGYLETFFPQHCRPAFGGPARKPL